MVCYLEKMVILKIMKNFRKKIIFFATSLLFGGAKAKPEEKSDW